MALLRFVAGRVLSMVLVLALVSLATYAVFYLLPSDPAFLSCGQAVHAREPRDRAAVHGLRPAVVPAVPVVPRGHPGRPHVRFRPDRLHCPAPCFGYSFQQNAPVSDLIASRVPVTFSLAIGAAVIWLCVGVGTGVVSALHRGRPLDRLLMAGSVAGVSAPTYLVGLLGILLFGFTLDVVPVSGYVPFTESPVDWAWHLVLPWLVLAFLHAALYARLTRNQMLNVLGEDFIRTARAKGVRESSVIRRHALRNVALPVVTIFGLDLGSLLGGAVITERVFSMPGLGGLLIDAVHQLDLPLLLGYTVFATFLIVVANTAVDLLYGLLDPRARLVRS